MTKKIAISVPDDVAERLAREPNVSAYVTESVRLRMAKERTREALVALGFTITDEAMDRVRAEMERLRESVTPELRAKAMAISAEIARVRATGRGAKEALERIERISGGEHVEAAA